MKFQFKSKTSSEYGFGSWVPISAIKIATFMVICLQTVALNRSKMVTMFHGTDIAMIPEHEILKG